VRVDEHTTTIGHAPVFYRTAGGSTSGAAAPATGTPLYLHDAITSSDDWLGFLERTGGVAPDLIGFGRSGKGGHLDYSPRGLTDFIVQFLGALAVDRVELVGHGWGGALALLLAMREPARVERVVLIDAVPLLPGFCWHRAARLWRRPVIGELVMGSTGKRQLRRQLRKGSVRADAWPPARVNEVWDQFDQGTQRALLRLHRAADERELVALGDGLGSVTAKALVIWGERDRWFRVEFAEAYRETLPHATLERIGDAGHWPWLEDPRVIDLVADFIQSP
jgi:pimeloyl-ACP methyl ester carboxylesterase